MKGRLIVLSTVLTIVAMRGWSQEKDYPITPVPFSKVRITDTFWSKKIRINHEVTIPIAYQKSEETGRIDNFKKAAGMLAGPFGTEYPFDDSDIYKIIEAASYSIQTYPDEKMSAMIDSLIYFVAQAQEPDGYLFTARTIKEGKGHPWSGNARWEKVNELSHELYNLGHMYEAAAAHYTATGKKTLLNVATRSADLICDTFGPGKLENYPGHQEVEIGLVKLYRITGNKRYLDLAKYFLDARGKQDVGRPDKYNQSHVKVTDQTEAVGHSVRASYMWTAMADVAAITGNEAYIKAINTLWHDVVDTKYYINGGIGSTGSHEGFGAKYELPNMTAYNETCAGVGNAAWNHRMFLMTGDSKYIDVLERTMYNNILTGVSYSGDHFFYPNPLSSAGQHERSEWFGCACCPPNVARFLPSMPGYIYAQRENELYINLYISNESTFTLPEGTLTVQQTSAFPWEGEVGVTIVAPKPIQATLKLRIPGWARNEPVPGDLYYYLDKPGKPFMLKLNGKAQPATVDAMGYVSLSRKWKKGDAIQLTLPVEIRKIKAHEKVEADLNRIAVERGPVLYCAEWADNDGHVQNLVVDQNTVFKASKKQDLFDGIVMIQGTARKASRTLRGEVQVSDPMPVKLIPYYLWNNRGPGEMIVWLPTTTESTKPLPAPTITAKSKITTSGRSHTLYVLSDQEIPSSSGEPNTTFFHWWPKQGTWEWIQFEFPETESIRAVKVYWADDGQGTRLPDTWEVVYQKGPAGESEGEWMPVKSSGTYAVSKDEWNTLSFDKIKADRIRVRVKLNEKYSAGIHEIVIE